MATETEITTLTEEHVELIEQRVFGGECPFCGGNIATNENEWGDGDYWTRMSCVNDHEWHEVYKLVIVEDEEITTQLAVGDAWGRGADKMRAALAIIAGGNTDPDRMVEIAAEALR